MDTMEVSEAIEPKPRKSSQEVEQMKTEAAMDEALLYTPVVDIKSIMSSNTPEKEMKALSWKNMPPGKGNPATKGRISDPVLFSDLVKRSQNVAPEVQFTKKYIGPTIKDCPLPELARKPGHVPVLKYFHLESHREREGSSDDGLYADDLAAADEKLRKKLKTKNKADLRRHTHIHEAIVMVKGEFTFIHRTYRPKVQIPFRVPAGQAPQSVVVERLQRLYRRTDINAVCRPLGIELSDLIPPAHYGEQNERFYQEAMFRCRTRVYGQDKREFIRDGGGDGQEGGKKKGKRRRTMIKLTALEEENESLDSSEPGEDDDEAELSQHPFAKTKPPFGIQFPLDFFDNEEYDIRSGEDWIKLGLTKGGLRICPIPGKAFLPLPMLEMRKFLPSLSEVTYGNLLTQSKKLKGFREWILKERYIRRTGENAAIATIPTEAQLAIFARDSTTVMEVIPDYEDGDRRSSSGSERKLSSRRQTTAEDDLDDSLFDDDDGEYDGEDAGEDRSSLGSIDWAKERGVDDDLDDIIEQFRAARPKPTESKEVAKIEGPVKSESLLSDINSDCLSDLHTPEQLSKTASQTLAEIAEEEASETELEMTPSALARAVRQQGTSPDIDPYEQDGWEKLIFEYDKMKKVHIYDWRWVDCAVFDYDPVTRRYLVRSISPPYCYAWINKLYLLMDGEDPNRHGERIKDAIVRRIESEYIMRYNLYIDCLPVTKDTQEMLPVIRENILLRTLSTPKLKKSSSSMKKVQREINLEWERTHMKLHFDDVVRKHPRLYRPWVIPLGPDDRPKWEATPSTTWQPVVQRFKECTTCNFTYKVARIQKKSVIYKIEPYTALMEIVAACWEARKKPFILVNQIDSISIDEYELRQKGQMKEVSDYLKNEWMESVLSSVREHLEKIPRSWYNIAEHRWGVYNMSKVSNYLKMIRFLLEDTLAFMVEESLQNFVQELDILTRNCTDIDKDFYEWQNDLKISDFPPPEDMVPPFKVELTMEKRGPKYTHLLSKCRIVLTHIYYCCIDAASGIPDIIPQIMKNLLFGTARNLRSVGKLDKLIVQLKKDMNKFLHRGLIPVDIYAQKYKYYMPVWNLDLPKFLKDWTEGEHSTKEIRHAVDFHMKHYKEIDSEIPSHIDIACCRVNVKVLKAELLKRKKNLYVGILEAFATKLRNQVLEIKEEYEVMEKRLSTRSDDIEEVMELKAYVESVPHTLMVKGEIIMKILKDYDLFGRFKFPISAEDTENKWTVALGTNRMARMAEDAVGFLDDDYDRLLKVQQADLSALSDAVDSATLSVAGLVAYVEMPKAIEVSGEVKKVWKQVKELQETSELLNKRQRIFGLPPAQNEALVRLGNDIEPYKHLWFTAADWLRLKDNIFNATLDKVDIDSVQKMVTEGAKTIRRCIKFFEGSDVIQHIAEEVYHEIKSFRPLVPLIRTLKNTGMRQRHWEEISAICGFTVVAKGNQSFKKLLDQGITEFAGPIAQVGDRATEEAKIESSLDKMLYEINKFKITTATEPTNIVQITVIPPDVPKTVEAFIKRTDEILASPYRAPFEERLGIWDKRIRQTRENLIVWQQVQKVWVEMQDEFKITDFALKLPAEHKMFLKLERIWRRISRLVRDMPYVLDVGSDTTLRASLSQFTIIIEKCKKGLEEFMKPSNSDSDEDIPSTKHKSKTAPVASAAADQPAEHYMPEGFSLPPPEKKPKAEKSRTSIAPESSETPAPDNLEASVVEDVKFEGVAPDDVIVEPTVTEDGKLEAPVSDAVKLEEPVSEVKPEGLTPDVKLEEPTSAVKLEEPSSDVKLEETTSDAKALASDVKVEASVAGIKPQPEVPKQPETEQKDSQEAAALDEQKDSQAPTRDGSKDKL